MSEMDILQDLENIINNPEKKKWKNIEVLIEYYKKKLEEQRAVGLQMMGLVLKLSQMPKTAPFMVIKDEKQGIVDSQAVMIHCILEGEKINIETCKKCQNQCVYYKKSKNQT